MSIDNDLCGSMLLLFRRRKEDKINKGEHRSKNANPTTFITGNNLRDGSRSHTQTNKGLSARSHFKETRYLPVNSV